MMAWILINTPRIVELFILCSFAKYMTFYLLHLVILLKTACILTRHVIFPFIGLDSSRLAITLLSTFSEFIVLLCLTVLYRPQIESEIFLSGNSDDSDYVVIVSVILTQYLFFILL